METTVHKYEGRIQENYDEYLAEPQRIGFTESFPVKEVLEEREYKMKCRGFDVQFKVQYCLLSFGDKNEYTVHGIVTERVDIGSKLGARSFGSYCHIDEAETMEEGVVKLCKELDLMVCQKVCSWPFAKILVQPNHFKD